MGFFDIKNCNPNQWAYYIQSPTNAREWFRHVWKSPLNPLKVKFPIFRFAGEKERENDEEIYRDSGETERNC